jgi:hypothetical protein
LRRAAHIQAPPPQAEGIRPLRRVEAAAGQGGRAQEEGRPSRRAATAAVPVGEAEEEIRPSHPAAAAAAPLGEQEVGPSRPTAAAATPLGEADEEVRPSRPIATAATPLGEADEEFRPSRPIAATAGPVGEADEAIELSRPAAAAAEAESVAGGGEAPPTRGSARATAPGIREEPGVQAAARARSAAESGAEEEDQPRLERPGRRSEGARSDGAERPPGPPLQPELAPQPASPRPDFTGEEELAGSPAPRRAPAPRLPPPDAPRAADPTDPAPSISEPPLPPDRGRAGWSERAAAFADREPNFGPAFAPPDSVGASVERPQVIIDRLDVLVHEPAPSRSDARPAPDRGRMLRARYLRRL